MSSITSQFNTWLVGAQEIEGQSFRSLSDHCTNMSLSRCQYALEKVNYLERTLAVHSARSERTEALYCVRDMMGIANGSQDPNVKAVANLAYLRLGLNEVRLYKQPYVWIDYIMKIFSRLDPLLGTLQPKLYGRYLFLLGEFQKTQGLYSQSLQNLDQAQEILFSYGTSFEVANARLSLAHVCSLNADLYRTQEILWSNASLFSNYPILAYRASIIDMFVTNELLKVIIDPEMQKAYWTHFNVMKFNSDWILTSQQPLYQMTHVEMAQLFDIRKVL